MCFRFVEIDVVFGATGTSFLCEFRVADSLKLSASISLFGEADSAPGCAVRFRVSGDVRSHFGQGGVVCIPVLALYKDAAF